MKKTKLLPIIILAALATAVIAAPGAHADTLSCTTSGTAGPITPPVQNVIADLGTIGGDSLTGDPLTDTDNGVREPNAGWEDGNYLFHSDTGVCMAVDTDGPADDGFRDTGLYSAVIDSAGAYDNTVCGTGLAIDRGAGDLTQVALTPLAATGPGEGIVEANYRITFSAGTGPIVISSARNSSGETLSGGGWVHITPVVGNCVTTDVTEFDVAATFTLAGAERLGE